jgi:4-hydroxybenzoate polyprenyltransferase
MIKFSHTLFALPFAAAATLVAAGGLPSGRQLLGILAAMVGARSAAMAFNRLADTGIDRENPRTAGRHLPAGLLSRAYVTGFTAAAAGVFVLACAWLNPLCLALSPVALAWILGYSFTKRFTAASHLWLGVALGMAPVGAWTAVRGTLADPAPWWLGAGVALWTAGFDLLYACQDVAFDRKAGLHAVPARYGVPAALRLSVFLHVLAMGGFVLFARTAGLGSWTWGSLAVVGAALLWEHALVRPDDLSRLDAAFFTANAAVSAVITSGVALDVLT